MRQAVSPSAHIHPPRQPHRFRHPAAILAVVLGLAVSALLPTSTSAQTTLKIAAVVNDDIISVYDLGQRIGLVVSFSNLPPTPETQQRIAGDVLRRLIVEQLRLQEAERLEIEIPDEAITAAIRDLEAERNMPPGSMPAFLESRGIDIETLRKQIRAEAAWVQVVRTLFARIVTVSEQEVEDVLTEMKENAGKPEYLVAEIFLPYDDTPRDGVEQTALRLHDQLKNGASFQQLARNFSRAVSASRGGDLGWNNARELGPVLSAVVRQLSPGQLSSPIATDEGVYIVLLRDQRASKGLEITESEVTVGIQKLHLAIPEAADPRTVTEITARAAELAESADTCAALDALGKTEGSPLSGFLGEFKLADLNPQLRETIRPLTVEETTQPLRTADGVMVLMVCSRSGAGEEDPLAKARAEIRSRLLNERYGRQAQQHMEKLRREAFIEIRI